jgi:YggT family protein
MRLLLQTLDVALAIYTWLLFAVAVIYWLTGFKAVRADNRAIVAIAGFLRPITEPALRATRFVFPQFGGVDVSPVILIVLILALRYVAALFILPKLS